MHFSFYFLTTGCIFIVYHVNVSRPTIQDCFILNDINFFWSEPFLIMNYCCFIHHVNRCVRTVELTATPHLCNYRATSKVSVCPVFFNIYIYITLIFSYCPYLCRFVISSFFVCFFFKFLPFSPFNIPSCDFCPALLRSQYIISQLPTISEKKS